MANRLARLERDFAELARRITVLEGSPQEAAPAGSLATISVAAAASPGGWTEPARFLRQAAIVTFALLVALLLRTLTDNGTLARLPGTLLGVGYAGVLIAAGSVTLRRNSPGKSLVPTCGAVLMAAIVIEAHGRFGTLSLAAAVSVLAATMVATGWLGLRHAAPALAEVGVLTALLTGLSLGFPDPHFVGVSILLALAMWIGTGTYSTRPRAWLPWPVLLATLCFWLLWSVKLAFALRRPDVAVAGLQGAAFVPASLLLLAVHLAVAAARLRREPTAPGALARCLPAVSATGLLAAAATVASAWAPVGPQLVGGGGAVLAAALLAMAPRLRGNAATNGLAAGAVAFAAAGVLTLVPSIALLGVGPVWTALAWSATALCLMHAGARRSSGLRLLAGAICGLAVAALVSSGVRGNLPFVAAVLAPLPGLVLSASAWVHYRLSIAAPPPASSWYGALAPTDPLRAVPLVGAVAALYHGLRSAMRPVVDALARDPSNAFAAAQSVALNGMSLALLLASQRTKNRDLGAMAAAVALLGGVKVFAADLLACRGVPLLFSVFSFGLVALVASLMLSRRAGAPSRS